MPLLLPLPLPPPLLRNDDRRRSGCTTMRICCSEICTLPEYIDKELAQMNEKVMEVALAVGNW